MVLFSLIGKPRRSRSGSAFRKRSDLLECDRGDSRWCIKHPSSRNYQPRVAPLIPDDRELMVVFNSVLISLTLSFETNLNVLIIWERIRIGTVGACG